MNYTRFLTDDEILQCKQNDGHFMERYVIYSIKIPTYAGQTSFRVKDNQDVTVQEYPGKIWTIRFGVPQNFIFPDASEVKNGDLAYWDEECVILVTNCYEMMKDYESLLKRASFSYSEDWLIIS